MTANGKSVTAVDLFAGPGGWDQAARELGMLTIGIEYDAAACQTRAAAGHLTIRADVSAYDPARFSDMDGVIASPPCQALSTAGKGAGVEHVPALCAAIIAGDWTLRPDPDPRVWLALEVGRWVEAIEPEWVALEQVPPAMALWNAYSIWLATKGYKVAAGILNAADFGVPQTRKRAILIARKDRQPHLPEPTHCPGGASSLFGELLPWVSMAEALGWGYLDRPTTTFCGSNEGGPDLAGGSGARAALKAAQDGGRFILDRRQTGAPVLDCEKVPAPTLTAAAVGKGVWTVQLTDEQRWAEERPSTTIVGSFSPDTVAPPTFRGPGDGPRQSQPGSIKITERDALTLQSFPADYPVQGSRTKRFEQIGNAVPPGLARPVLLAATDLSGSSGAGGS